jgi:hypothetical protein
LTSCANKLRLRPQDQTGCRCCSDCVQRQVPILFGQTWEQTRTQQQTPEESAGDKCTHIIDVDKCTHFIDRPDAPDEYKEFTLSNKQKLFQLRNPGLTPGRDQPDATIRTPWLPQLRVPPLGENARQMNLSVMVIGPKTPSGAETAILRHSVVR